MTTRSVIISSTSHCSLWERLMVVCNAWPEGRVILAPPAHSSRTIVYIEERRFTYNANVARLVTCWIRFTAFWKDYQWIRLRFLPLMGHNFRLFSFVAPFVKGVIEQLSSLDFRVLLKSGCRDRNSPESLSGNKPRCVNIKKKTVGRRSWPECSGFHVAESSRKKGKCVIILVLPTFFCSPFVGSLRA